MRCCPTILKFMDATIFTFTLIQVILDSIKKQTQVENDSQSVHSYSFTNRKTFTFPITLSVSTAFFTKLTVLTSVYFFERFIYQLRYNDLQKICSNLHPWHFPQYL